MKTDDLEEYFGSAAYARDELHERGIKISQQLWSLWKYSGIPVDVQSTIQIKLKNKLLAGDKVASAERVPVPTRKKRGRK